MSGPVIAAIDPHRDDSGAAALGVLLARVSGDPLVLASAYAVDPPVDRLYPEYAQAMRDETERHLARLRAQVQRDAGGQVAVSATAIADAAAPAAALHRLAARRNAAVIVVGSSARGLTGRLQPGAVTDRLLHGAPCAVAVAPAGYVADEPALGTIGVAFVERADGRAALAHACELARAAGGRLRVLTVREPSDWEITSPLEPRRLVAAERARDEAAERALQAGIDSLPEAHSAGGELLTGRPQDALAAASTELDLLVCGSRGYGPVRTLLLGGVSHSLVRRAACPVVVVPMAAETGLGARDLRSRSCHGSPVAVATDVAQPRAS